VPRYTAVEPEVTALNAPAHRACRLPWNAQDQGPFGKLRAGSGAPSAWTGDLAGTGAARRPVGGVGFVASLPDAEGMIGGFPRVLPVAILTSSLRDGAGKVLGLIRKCGW
jgi:hypothetical protein